MASPTLLIDADLLVFKVCSGCEEEIAWGDGLRSIYIRESDAEAGVSSLVDLYMGECMAEDAILCFSSSSNFRKQVLPEYKGNRGSRKPIGYSYMREWCDKNYRTFEKEGLEADDLLGILATKGEINDPIIVSEDKDLRQIPGRLFNPRTLELNTIDVEEGNYYHLFQCLVGDRVDNYRGCPGVGEVKAGAILDGARGDGYLSAWNAVVGAFDKAGLSDIDAITQARVAKILTAEWYDFDKGEPILWMPPES